MRTHARTHTRTRTRTNTHTGKIPSFSVYKQAHFKYDMAGVKARVKVIGMEEAYLEGGVCVRVVVGKVADVVLMAEVHGERHGVV